MSSFLPCVLLLGVSLTGVRFSTLCFTFRCVFDGGQVSRLLGCAVFDGCQVSRFLGCVPCVCLTGVKCQVPGLCARCTRCVFNGCEVLSFLGFALGVLDVCLTGVKCHVSWVVY